MSFSSQLLEATSNFEEVEKNVSSQEGSYPGLSQEALLTALEDFQIIFDRLGDIHSWVELGSGHGHGPLLFAHLHQDKLAIGIEFEEARFLESLRLKHLLNIQNVTFIHADLLTTPLPQADSYFLYFPTGKVLDRILYELGGRDNSFRLIVIESHGDLIPRLKLENWLCVEEQIPLSSTRHYPQAMVFRKVAKKAASIFDYSFLNHYFVIRDHDGQEWVGDSLGLEWQIDHSIRLLHPPRTIREDQICRILQEHQLPSEILPLLTLRRQGPVEIETKQGNYFGLIRKIFLNPWRLELSTAQVVPLHEITKIMAGNT